MGLVIGKCGPTGGNHLARPAAAISFAEILRCIDGPLALAPGASLTAYRRCADCKSIESCQIGLVLLAVRNTTSLLLEGMSLAEAAPMAGYVTRIVPQKVLMVAVGVLVCLLAVYQTVRLL